MPAPTQRDLNRFQYWQGQMLRSRDFKDQGANDAQLRWWHDRSLHNSFGVAWGLDVQIHGRAVDVTPGAAYDFYGRELLHQRRTTVEIPAKLLGEKPVVLMVRYRENEQFRIENDLVNVCLPDGRCAVLMEQPEFFWTVSGELRPEEGVPLAQMKAGLDSITVIETFMRPVARSLSRPLIFSGATIPRNTNWASAQEPEVFGVEVDIDTSSAGFLDVPCYFAWLQVIPTGEVAEDLKLLKLALAGQIDRASVDGFRFRLLLGPKMIGGLLGARKSKSLLAMQETNLISRFLVAAATRKLFVWWLAIYEAKHVDRQDEVNDGQNR